MGLFEMLAAGGDAATIAIVYLLYRMEKRVTQLEWSGKALREQVMRISGD